MSICHSIKIHKFSYFIERCGGFYTRNDTIYFFCVRVSVYKIDIEQTNTDEYRHPNGIEKDIYNNPNSSSAKGYGDNVEKKNTYRFGRVLHVACCKSSTISHSLCSHIPHYFRLNCCHFLVSKHGHSAHYILAYLSSDAGNHFILNTIYTEMAKEQ